MLLETRSDVHKEAAGQAASQGGIPLEAYVRSAAVTAAVNAERIPGFLLAVCCAAGMDVLAAVALGFVQASAGLASTTAF